MTINEFLARPHELEKAIILEQEKLQKYRAVAESCTSNWSGINAGSSYDHSKAELWVEKITESEKRLDTLRLKYEKAMMHFIDAIYSFDSTTGADVLEKRYIQRLSLNNIAITTGYCRRNVLRIIKKYTEQAENWILRNHPEYLEEDNCNDK